MLHKTDETKVMRDPVHGYIHVDYQIIWDCINAKEFQRLRRIHQLGGDFQVYHTADHTRFSHSLGVYEIVRRMVSEIKQLEERLSEYEKVTVMLAGLLHDVGHGPFSHAFESVSLCKHEVYTKQIILGDTQLHDIIYEVDKDLPNAVANIITYEHENDLLNQIVSGQLDADRMDYLLRDAYFTGTSYGNFDLERIIRTMRVKDKKLVVKESGIHSVEDYIMARYHMYWQVYLHPVARCFEGLLNVLFMRMQDVYDEDSSKLTMVPMFLPFLKPNVASLQEHFYLDEAAANYGFQLLSKHEDKILSDLSSRILNRDLFEYCTISSDTELKSIQKRVMDIGYDPRYYVYKDAVSQIAYSPYKHTSAHKSIWLLCVDDKVRELSQISEIVRAISEVKSKEDKKIYFPKEACI